LSSVGIPQIIGMRDKREIPNTDRPINRYQRSFRMIPTKKFITANPAQVIVRRPVVVSETLTVHHKNMAIEADRISTLCILADMFNEFLNNLETC